MAKRSTYHHGDLRAALIRAADEIIAQEGIEAFTLRAAAKRAGFPGGSHPPLWRSQRFAHRGGFACV